MRPAGARRLYALNPAALRDVVSWLERFRAFWTPALDALETELAHSRRARRVHHAPPPSEGDTP